MKRLLFMVAILISIFNLTSIAQKKFESNFYSRGGLVVFVPWEYQHEPLFFPALSFAPGLRMIQGTDFSLVATVPISAGIAFISWNESYFGFDLPAMLEMHFSSATGNSQNNKAGFILGAGAGYHFTGYNHVPDYTDYTEPPYYEYHQLDFWGYRLEAGVSFGKDETGTGERMMVLGQFGQSLAHERKYTVGLGVYLITGNRKKQSKQTMF